MERKGIAAFVSSPEEEGDERENIASDITQLIGWTPLIELKQITQKDGIDVRLVGKIESYQPLCSVKDRSALRMIEDAEEKGLITPGVTTLVEPTSGNLGISLAYIAARKGYKFIAVMPDHYSVERRIILKYLGADIELTDYEREIPGVTEKLDQLKERIPNMHVLDQFSNPANPEAHFIGTGPEIWKDTAGKVDIFVCGSGSGGTISGAGRYLRMKNPSLKIICVEPVESAVISGGNPGSHDIQGIGPSFIPNNLDSSLIDEVITVSTEEAMTCARRLAREEGLLVGISSGAALAACLKVARRSENKGKIIVTILASGGERYLSTGLFSEIGAAMVFLAALCSSSRHRKPSTTKSRSSPLAPSLDIITLEKKTSAAAATTKTESSLQPPPIQVEEDEQQQQQQEPPPSPKVSLTLERAATCMPLAMSMSRPRRRKLSGSLSMSLPDGILRIRIGKKEEKPAEEYIWKKTIILGDRCRVPSDDEETVFLYDENGNRRRNYRPRTPRSLPVSRTNSFVDRDDHNSSS